MSQPVLRLYDGYDHTSPDRRAAVKELQSLLKQKGFSIGVDGHFGPGTELVVREFQKKSKQPVDGIVGPMTWARLLDQPPETQSRNAMATSYRRDDRIMLQQMTIAESYRSGIKTGANSCKLPESVVAAIASRESGWGIYLKPKGVSGTGDSTERGPSRGLPRDGRKPPDGGGFGRGVMQIDFDYHAFARGDQWQDPVLNIAYGCKVLSDARKILAARTELKGFELNCAILASYNCGPGNVLTAVRQGKPVDFFTTGRDYSADVLNRAGFFQLHGWA